MTGGPPSILWFRRDLRLDDHPALVAAAAGGGPVVPLFVLDPALLDPAGARRVDFLLGCLAALRADTGGALVVRAGDPATVVAEVARQAGATSVFVSGDAGPYGRRRDEAVAASLERWGATLQPVGTPYAVAPGALRTGAGGPFRVFTPYHRAWLAHGWPAPVAPPAGLRWGGDLASDALPAPGGPPVVAAGERAALHQLDSFLDRVDRYAVDRDRPDLDATSRLSPHLKLGCIHPRQILARLGPSPGETAFARELCWRDFYADVLHHQPQSARVELQPAMATIEVDTGAEADRRFTAWAEGRTGYPLVDAGMRQLRAEGWIHNRVRMLVASFLVKHLHLDWRRGARELMRRLVDGDLASNQHGWQWTAGTGTDAAPYFRVFNPSLQAERFDPDGTYIRRWVPELAGLKAPGVHQPWRLPGGPPNGYPLPIVDHAAERAEALRRYEAVRARR